MSNDDERTDAEQWRQAIAETVPVVDVPGSEQLDPLAGEQGDAVGRWLTENLPGAHGGRTVPTVEELAFGETSVKVSSDGCIRTVTIPAWWTREGQPEVWIDGAIGPGGEYAAMRVWPPEHRPPARMFAAQPGSSRSTGGQQ